jgi:hypothetical protein
MRQLAQLQLELQPPPTRDDAAYELDCLRDELSDHDRAPPPRERVLRVVERAISVLARRG